MDVEEIARRYVRLGLRAGRLRPGLVDAYLGPEQVRRAAEAAPVVPLGSLRAEAGLLRRELGPAGPGPSRPDFLARQLDALSCVLAELDGEPGRFAARLAVYLDAADPRHPGDGLEPGDPDRYREVHARLAELLPGAGSLASRVVAYRERERVPSALLGACVQELAARLRDRTRAVRALPVGEAVYVELATDKPWSALTRALGGHHSLVTVNTDAQPRVAQLARLVAHETYPGHHTEHCRTAELPPERALHLVNTPWCVLSEGLAEAGLAAAAGPDWGVWTERALAGLGVRTDGALAQAVEEALDALAPVRLDAVLLLHSRQADPDAVVEYLRRWLLLPEARARQVLRFLVHPLWRSYSATYVLGHPLVRRWLAAAPDEPALDRHQRLLDRPWTPSALRRALAEEPVAGRPAAD